MNELSGISIIVVNYNYGRFLAAAIDSALDQDHPLCEVIVIDDGSTDESRGIIARYGDRIRCLLREANGGQVAAQNSAWPLARHPILIFLDSDDLLFPHAAATVAGLWTAETVKMQFPLVTIDKSGRRLSHVAPKYPPRLNTETIRTELLRAGGSPNSPGSGNAYSRSLLERLSAEGAFDLPNSREYYMDAILECNAPFYGEVVTMNEPLACYRVHGSNVFAINSIDNARFDLKCHTFELKIEYLARRCHAWGIPFDLIAVRNSSTWLMECRLAAAKLSKKRLNEPIFTMWSRAIKAYWDAPMLPSQRIVCAIWFVSVAIAPRAAARRLIALRFTVTERPAWFERLRLFSRSALDPCVFR
jgi:glycosyltransferase involved in cell wall biosynthesis